MSNIRYASIRSMDISNGEGVGVALFVQGCPSPHCKNCFNPETWDFNGGKEWTEEIENKFIELASRPYIKRISILGGEPLADENLDGVLHLVNRFRLLFPNKSIWIYTGYKIEDIGFYKAINDYFAKGKDNFKTAIVKEYNNLIRQVIISQCDVLVDGRYIDSQRDITLKWRGSKNQRVIDIQRSLQNGDIILWT